MFIRFLSGRPVLVKVSSVSRRSGKSPIVAMSSQRKVVFGGNIVTAFPSDASSHCSAPPLQSSFRLPRLSRDAEAVTRPRTPLRPAKREEASEAGATFDYGIDRLDEVVEFKLEVVDATEGPVEAEEEREVRAQLCALRVAPPAPAADCPRRPGRPKGSRSRPRVEPRHDISAPPERVKAREATARIAAMKR